MTEDKIHLVEGYKTANCCSPRPDCEISGYFSHNGIMVVHRNQCINLNKVDPERIIKLSWPEILDKPPEKPDDDYELLEELDLMIMLHHREYGVDYSLKVARVLHEDKQAVFDSHNKLREMNILKRVKPLIIQYRKGIVDNKWIKHRNHTYYQLTEKGDLYLDHYLEDKTS